MLERTYVKVLELSDVIYVLYLPTTARNKFLFIQKLSSVLIILIIFVEVYLILNFNTVLLNCYNL